MQESKLQFLSQVTEKPYSTLSRKLVAVFEAKNGKTKHNLKCTLISEVSKLQFFLQVTEKPYSTLGNQLRCLTQKLAK